jgi:hypothetical protein
MSLNWESYFSTFASPLNGTTLCGEIAELLKNCIGTRSSVTSKPLNWIAVAGIPVNAHTADGLDFFGEDVMLCGLKFNRFLMGERVYGLSDSSDWPSPRWATPHPASGHLLPIRCGEGIILWDDFLG